MAYIIDDAVWIVEKKVKKGSLLIKNDRIQAIRADFKRYQLMRMNTSPFFMTPVHVMADIEHPQALSFHDYKDYISKQFLSKGCATLLTGFEVHYLHQFEEEMKRKRTSLINSPLDYVLGVKTTPKNITPEFIRVCKRHKIPLIWLEFQAPEELLDVKWGWIKEATHSYPITFAPYFSTSIQDNQKESSLGFWRTLLENENILHYSDEIPQNTPLSLELLKRIGLYPKRGNFLVGGEVSYNLYKGPEGKDLEELSTIHYDKHELVFTMNKGKVFYMDSQCYYYPGDGQQISIQNPMHFI